MANKGNGNRLERYEIMRIDRSQIKNAPYNPRTITESAAKKLRKSLKDFGALAPITWNRRTGNIVGGHQRIDAMDALLRSKEYELTVAAVDLEPAEEVKANIVLNNPAVQGEWDNEKLASIKMDFPEIDFASDLGFDKYDIDLLFAGTELEEDVFTAFEEQKPIKDELEKMREIDQIKAAKKAGRESAKAENESGDSHQVEKDDYMITFVFPNNEEKHDFMRHMGDKVDERYLRHTKLYDIQDGKVKAYGKLE